MVSAGAPPLSHRGEDSVGPEPTGVNLGAPRSARDYSQGWTWSLCSNLGPSISARPEVALEEEDARVACGRETRTISGSL